MLDETLPGGWLESRLDALRAAAGASGYAWPQGVEFERVLRATLVVSDYAFEQLRRRPVLLGALQDLQRPTERTGQPECDQTAPEQVEEDTDGIGGLVADPAQEAGVRLRRYRHARSLRLIARDAAGLSSLEETLAESSRLAETCIEWALRSVEQASDTARQWLDRDGRPLRLAVIGMGKLGGGELNFSSDIDLIFACADPRPGDLEDAERALARIGQRVINLLSANEADGFVHRVDMRLRPFGSVGRLVSPQSVMEQYYQREGRDWERYAWVKARAVGGDRDCANRIITLLRPFVFRKYLDYAAIDSLREMKSLIDTEVARADRRDDLKLGPGGIREIEFLVQLTQLTRGGREPALAVPQLLTALAAARALGVMPAPLAEMLADAYRELRRIENRVQMLRDEQTHRLPDDALARARIACGLGFRDFDALASHLAGVRARVASAFADTLVPRRPARAASADGDAITQAASNLWRAACEGERDSGAASVLGFDAADLDGLVALAANGPLRALADRHAARRDRLLPALIAGTAERAAGSTALHRVLALVRAIAGRPSYIALLDERAGARERVLDVFTGSGFLAEQVIAHPLLLDDLLDDRRERFDGPEVSAADSELHTTLRMRQELDARLGRIGDDPEDVLECLHEFKLAHQFRLGLEWLARRRSADAIAADLGTLAEVLAAATHARAWLDVSTQHGPLVPADRDGLLMLGYGSLGARELGFASDLDLVFAYDTKMSEATREGLRAIDGARWFARRVQRTVHWLSTATRAGPLYAVDVRLRPDGGKGLLVTSFEGFEAYQRERAWTWELQALVRARPIAGDLVLRERFARLRSELICAPRNAKEVSCEIAAMRTRWRSELDRSDAVTLDLKQGEGGLVDLEFLMQGFVLIHARQHPGLAATTRTRALIALATQAGLLSSEVGAALENAHETLLAESLSCTLDGRPRRTQRTPSIEAAVATIRAACAANGLVSS